MSLIGLAPERSRFGLADLSTNAAIGASRQEVRESGVLYEPDAPAESLYYIESGQVRIYQIAEDGSTRLADIFGAGDWFGIAALSGGTTYGARAIAFSLSVVWTLPASQMLAVIARDSILGRELIGQLAMRLEEANSTAARMMFEDCDQRLVQTLLRFSRTSAATTQDDGMVVLRITHQQLAQAVGAARETVSLGLTQLRQRNLLVTGRNRLSFNPGALEQHCREQAGSGQLVKIS